MREKISVAGLSDYHFATTNDIEAFRQSQNLTYTLHLRRFSQPQPIENR